MSFTIYISSRIDINDFRYEQIDDDVLRIDIDFCIEGSNLQEVVDDREILDEFGDTIDKEINEILGFEEEVERLEIHDENNEEVDEVIKAHQSGGAQR